MTRLYVGRLNSRVGERDLERFFKGYGKIKDIMMKNGYAFLVSRYKTITFHLRNDLRAESDKCCNFVLLIISF